MTSAPAVLLILSILILGVFIRQSQGADKAKKGRDLKRGVPVSSGNDGNKSATEVLAAVRRSLKGITNIRRKHSIQHNRLEDNVSAHAKWTANSSLSMMFVVL